MASSDLGSYDTVEDVWSHIDVTTFVRNVIDETWDNHGLLLHARGTGQGNWKRIASLGQDDPDLRPHMTVTWYLPEALIDWPDEEQTDSRLLNWNFDDGDGETTVSATQSEFRVQVSTDDSFAGTVPDRRQRRHRPARRRPAGRSRHRSRSTESTTYHWRVKVNDGTFWSGWTESTFTWTERAAREHRHRPRRRT